MSGIYYILCTYLHLSYLVYVDVHVNAPAIRVVPRATGAGIPAHHHIYSSRAKLADQGMGISGKYGTS